MRSKFFLLILAFLFSWQLIDCQKSHLLSDLCTPEFLAKNIQAKNTFRPFPSEHERDKWNLVSDSLKVKYVGEGEKLLHHQWNVLPVSDFLSFYRNGNRVKYEEFIFQRRRQLSTLVMAEVVDGKGRFTDDIINGIWATCEETFWGIPAHLDYRNKTKGFPDADNQIVDLFVAETSGLLAWTYYMLADELDSISPVIRQRMYTEVNKRMLEPCMKTNFWWMGFNKNETSNWNPWINSNWLTCTLLMESDSIKRIASLERSLKSLDNFIDNYPTDGGCDEGPSYWTRAGGALYQCLGIVFKASKGAINLYNDKKVAEISRYIYRLHIDGHYFVNFADASAIVSPNPGLLYSIGKQTNDRNMIAFSSYFAHLDSLGKEVTKSEYGPLYDVLSSFEAISELKNLPTNAPLLADSWLPNIQVCSARSYEGSAKGFFFAALGGHNAEGHNHNDVGSFILYYNGKPFLIDAGVGDYTAQTFGSNRYDIWTMQSAYHNLPTINGLMQKDGAQFKATQVHFNADKHKAIFTVDISKAYPKEANVKSWLRTYTFNRTTDLIINESYELQSFTTPFSLSFMSFPEPILKKVGEIEFQVDKRILKLIYPSSLFEVSIEKKEYTDARLIRAWGRKYLYRIVLKSLTNSKKDTYSIKILPEEGNL